MLYPLCTFADDRIERDDDLAVIVPYCKQVVKFAGTGLLIAQEICRLNRVLPKRSAPMNGRTLLRYISCFLYSFTIVIIRTIFYYIFIILKTYTMTIRPSYSPSRVLPQGSRQRDNRAHRNGSLKPLHVMTLCDVIEMVIHIGRHWSIIFPIFRE